MDSGTKTIYPHLKAVYNGNHSPANTQMQIRDYESWPRLNIKTVFPRAGDSYVKDKRPSYL